MDAREDSETFQTVPTLGMRGLPLARVWVSDLKHSSIIVLYIPD